MQVYLFTVVYLFLASCVLLSEDYGYKFLFLINIQNFFYKKALYQILSGIICSLLIVFNLVMPVSPGPIILGDILPATVLFFILIKHFSAKKKGSVLGFTALATTLIHLVFPNFVVI